MYLLHTATFRASECDEKALKGLGNKVLHAIFRSDFFFLGTLDMVSNSDARRRLYLWSDRPLLRYVLSWLGLGLTCQENLDF